MLTSKRLMAVVLIAASGLFGGCAVNPVTGKNEIAFVPESQELAIGQKNYGPYRQAQGGDYVVEPELSQYVKSVGGRLAKVSDRKLPYEFSILNDSTPNAWALPGGKISINRGLLVELDNEAELAAVLAHEIVHAAARHSAQAMERGVFLQGALVAAGVALGGTDYRDVGMAAAGVGAQLTNQKFSRGDESEADAYGMQYMVRAGYDPAAAVRLQETFVRLAEGKEADWLSGLFASHPPSRERVAANREMVAKLGNPGGDVGQVRYQSAIARLKRTKPAYEAYDEARTAFKDGKLDTAMAKVDRAISIEPKEAAFYGLRGEIQAAKNGDKSALNDLDKAVALNPDYFRPLLVRGYMRQEAGDTGGAERDLKRSLSLLPTAEGYYSLGNVAAKQGKETQAIGYFQKAATSSSNIGKAASKRLAQLDLNKNPARYVATAMGLSNDGYLVVKIANEAGVDVRNVRVVVGPKSINGVRKQIEFGIDRVLEAGQAVQVKTDLGPMNVSKARGYGAVVSNAEPAR